MGIHIQIRRRRLSLSIQGTPGVGVSRGETHPRYDVDSAKSGWDEEIIEEQREDWNEDVLMDYRHNGDWVGAREHWAKFSVL
jgi:hypothetical protein